MSDYKILVNSYDDYTLAVEVGRLANNLEELKMKISNVKKDNGNTEITFSDGHKINIKDGDTPYINDDGFWMINGQSTGVNARGRIDFRDLTKEERLSIKGEKGDRGYTGDRGLQGLTGKTGEASRVVKTEYDNDGNTLITFNDNTNVKINRGKQGERGIQGVQGKVGPKGDQGEKGDPLKWEDLSYEQKASLKGETGDTGQASKILKTDYDSEGNTLITFNDKSIVKINRGPKGERGYKGDSTTTSSITKSGLTTTVNFTDGKSMQIQDGKSVNVSSYKILDDGNTEISFTDGKKAIIKKGQDGTVEFDELTEEQINMLKVPVVDDLETGGSDKALSAEQGKKLFKLIEKHHSPKPLIMTAVIDQANSNPLTCVTYEDDAKTMEKGSSEWDDFFQSQLVLFKDGKEVRELEDSELNDLKPEDGDVMVRFPRKGLRIKTVDKKVYVSMTNVVDDPDFKYYAHTRGNQRKNNFYLGAYLGYEESGKLRSIVGKESIINKKIEDNRTLAQANGKGYEILAFYQWTFLQAMYVLKYGNLNSQSSIGTGYIPKYASDDPDDIPINRLTGKTNGKGIDFGSLDNKTKIRFQWIEDFFGNYNQYCDGIIIKNNKIWIGTDNFNNTASGYKSYDAYDVNMEYIKSVIGNNEMGFIPESGKGSSTTYYCDISIMNIHNNPDSCLMVGGSWGGTYMGAFHISSSGLDDIFNNNNSSRLMFL